MKRIIKKIGKYLLYITILFICRILAGLCFTEGVLSDSFTRGWLFNLLGLICLIPYYYLIFRLVGLIKTDKEYKAKIKHLEDELFNTNFNKARELRELEERKNIIYSELQETKRLLQREYDNEYMWKCAIDEATKESIEAKAKYVELVNNSYRGIE